jgi:hypothetical protein
MATAITTEGDLIKGTGSGTFDRLGIGTAGQVLTVNSGATAPEWATPAAGSTLVGCSVYKITTAQSVANDTLTAITYGAETFDTDGFHDNTTNNSRITIPSGKGGNYLLYGLITFAANSSGQRSAAFRLNGTTNIVNAFSVNPTSAASFRLSTLTICTLTAGDYVEFCGEQNTGGSLNASFGPADSSFAAIYLGA